MNQFLRTNPWACTRILKATNAAGEVSFYTGRAGGAWVAAAYADAFTLGDERAQSLAAEFNRMTPLHGLTFTVEAWK